MKELEAIRSLAHKMPHDGNCRYTGSDFGPCHRCQLEALLPALEKALEKRDEVMLNQGAIAATNSIVTKQEAEIAALREVMNCGHPRACWQAVKPDSVDAVVGYRCIACEHERLAVAILLKSFYEFLPPELLESAAKKFGQYDGRALDAHDAAIRERTLQEVFSRWDREGEQDTWNWLCETLDEEKGGSK